MRSGCFTRLIWGGWCGSVAWSVCGGRSLPSESGMPSSPSSSAATCPWTGDLTWCWGIKPEHRCAASSVGWHIGGNPQMEPHLLSWLLCNTYGVGKSRSTMVTQINNAIINRYYQNKLCLSPTHSCKPTFAHPDICSKLIGQKNGMRKTFQSKISQKIEGIHEEKQGK